MPENIDVLTSIVRAETVLPPPPAERPPPTISVRVNGVVTMELTLPPRLGRSRFMRRVILFILLILAFPASAAPRFDIWEHRPATRALDLRALQALYRRCPDLKKSLSLVTRIEIEQQTSAPTWTAGRLGWPLYVSITATFAPGLTASSPILGSSGGEAIFFLGAGSHPGIAPTTLSAQVLCHQALHGAGTRLIPDADLQFLDRLRQVHPHAWAAWSHPG